MNLDASGLGIPLVGSSSSLPTAPYEDRSTGLVIFGILEIAGGAFAALLIPFLLLGTLIARKLPGGVVPLGHLAVTALSYAGAAAILITLGVGAIQAKRWAWALNLILSWVWLITGCLVTMALIVMVPQGALAGMGTAASQNGQHASPAVMAALVTFMIVCLAIFFVVLPLAFLLFYRSKNVELTAKHRDPVERWTDRRPLPLLAVVLLTALACVYYLEMIFSTPLFPFFGRYLTGVPAAALLFISAIVDAYIAISFFRLKVMGWWVAVFALGIRIVSAVLTLRRGDLLAAYGRIGWSRSQIEMMRASPVFRSGIVLWGSVALMLIYFIFLLWLRRYFRPTPAPGYTMPVDSVPTPPGS